MKITIEVSNESSIKQIEAVQQYIIDNNGFKVTGRVYGTKIKHSKGVNHVSCNKTKAGNYSFKVWPGV